MTYKEKVLMDHPEAKTTRTECGVAMCPSDYGYPEHCDKYSTCTECWNAEFPEPFRMKVMLDPGAKMPTRAHEHDVGYDLYSREDVMILERGNHKFDTGVHVAIPVGYAGMIKSKSGLNVNENITSEGVIDPDYTGSICVKLYNNGDRPVRIREGQKISQLVIMPVITPELELTDSMEETERGNGGFGSTGAF